MQLHLWYICGATGNSISLVDLRKFGKYYSRPTSCDLQSTICNIQSENEWLCKEIHKVTTLKENFKLEVEELTHQSNHFMD